MTTVAGIEPKDPYKVWKIVTMKKKNEEKVINMADVDSPLSHNESTQLKTHVHDINNHDSTFDESF